MALATKVFVDVETSGLDPFVHGPLTVGLYEPKSEAELLIQMRLGEDVQWTAKALEVNGIDESELHDEKFPLPADAAAEIVKFLGSIEGRVQLCGWNVSFDRGFLDNHVFEDVQPAIAYYWFDVASVASAMAQETYLSLAKASKKFGVTPEPPVHNALEGAKNCARVWLALEAELEMLYSSDGEW